jgi:hypothetical protein
VLWAWLQPPSLPCSRTTSKKQGISKCPLDCDLLVFSMDNHPIPQCNNRNTTTIMIMEERGKAGVTLVVWGKKRLLQGLKNMHEGLEFSISFTVRRYALKFCAAERF